MTKLHILFILYQTLYLVGNEALAVNASDDLKLSSKEASILSQFRTRVKPFLADDYMKSDFYLVRWLRAKDFDIFAAETMLATNLKWRKDNNMNNIRFENFEDMKRDFPTTVDTFDRDGRPVGTLDMSQWSIRNAIVTGRGQRLLRYINMLMENVTNQVLEIQANKMNATQWIVVMNSDGMNMVHHGCPGCIQIWIQFLISLENHYPGWLYEFIAIDAPLTVHTIINIARPFISRQTRERMHVFGTNRQQWMRYLDSKISRNQRTEIYGGIHQSLIQ